MPDHVRMLPAIPPKYSVSSVMGCLKGKGSLMIFDRHAEPEAQVRQQGVLDGGLLRLHRRARRGDRREVHQGAGGRRHRAGQAERQGVLRPVQEVAGARRSTGSPRVKGNRA